MHVKAPGTRLCAWETQEGFVVDNTISVIVTIMDVVTV